MTKGDLGKYVCLSHCWGSAGSKGMLRTTRDNFLELIQHIPWSRIPRTFRDAINVTRALGIEYIWIDSICIVQDDLKDWESQAAKMHKIYENSHVTIGATSASGPNGGLFLRQSSGAFQETGITASGAHFSMVGHKIWRHPMHYHAEDLPQGRSWPLLGRAWVFQERLLSPRFLHFTKNELIWECNKESLCECGDSRLESMSMKPGNHEALTSKTKENAVRGWHLMTSSYCSLKLSFESDKLPALSGLAAKMAAVRPGAQYLAGLWSDSIDRDLLWHVQDWKHRGEAVRRPAQWRAPTWSWVSLDAHIMYPDAETSTRLYQSIHGRTSPATGDVWGQVASGTLTICGTLFPARMEFKGSDDIDIVLEGQGVVASSNSDWTYEHQRWLHLDTVNNTSFLHELASNSTLFCLRVARLHESQRGNRETEYTLILCLRHNMTEYERVGIIAQGIWANDASMAADFWASTANPFAVGGEQRTIDIV